MGNGNQGGGAQGASSGSIFTKSVTERSWGKLALMGPSGTGKTFTALRLARALLEISPEDRQRVCVVGGEGRASAKYAKQFPDLDLWYVQPVTHSPETYRKMIERAEMEKFGVCIVDSLSNPWSGLGGALELVDYYTQQASNNNKFTSGWKVVSPLQNKMIEEITGSRLHVIGLLRSKVNYIMVKKDGRDVPKAVGLAPVQRDGVEFEFDVLCHMDTDLNCMVMKSRCSALRDKTFNEAGEDDLGKIFAEWLETGEEPKGRARVEFGDGAIDGQAAAEIKNTAPPPAAEQGDSRPPQDPPPAAGTPTKAASPDSGENPLVWRSKIRTLMIQRCEYCGVKADEHASQALNALSKGIGGGFGEDALEANFEAYEMAIADWIPEPQKGDGIPF